jgi:hypothetical protein
VIGEGNGWGFELRYSTAKPIDAAGAVEERVFRVNVKMYELTQALLLNPR